MGGLTVVATPIGNLEDITLRALRILRDADFILAEDTRHTRHLCQRHEIRTPLRSLHQHTDEARVAQLAQEIVDGAQVALVSDAGTPVVSDPGARLVEQVLALGGKVEAAPGPSAVTTAVSIAGLRADQFQFLGFLPRSGGRRAKQLDAIARSALASVLFEAPNRLTATLADLQTHCGAQRRAAVCRELTKLHEEVARGTLANLLEQFADGARGELTLVVEGHDGSLELPQAEPTREVDLDARIREGLERGLAGKQIARELARELGQDRRAIYARVVALQGQDGA